MYSYNKNWFYIEKGTFPVCECVRFIKSKDKERYISNVLYFHKREKDRYRFMSRPDCKNCFGYGTMPIPWGDLNK
jgi:hypothetical protein